MLTAIFTFFFWGGGKRVCRESGVPLYPLLPVPLSFCSLNKRRRLYGKKEEEMWIMGVLGGREGREGSRPPSRVRREERFIQTWPQKQEEEGEGGLCGDVSLAGTAGLRYMSVCVCVWVYVRYRYSKVCRWSAR